MKRILITALIVLGGVSLMQTIPSASGNLRYGNACQDSSIQYYVPDTIAHDLLMKYSPKRPLKLIEEDRYNWWGRAWWDGYAGYYQDSVSAAKYPLSSEPVIARLFVKDAPRGYSHNHRETLVLPPTKIDANPYLMWIFLRSNIISDDGNFRMWYNIYRNVSVEDSINGSRYSFGGIESDVYIPRNYMHMYSAWADLRISHGTAHFDLDSAVQYLTHKDARRMFNADTVITYPFNMKQFGPRGRFLDKYTHLQIYIVQRNERGFLALYCFTTDKGQRDFKKHFRALQKIFRYED